MHHVADKLDSNLLQHIQDKSLVRIVDDDESVARSYEFMLRCAG